MNLEMRMLVCHLKQNVQHLGEHVFRWSFAVLEESTLSLKFSGGPAIPLDGANFQSLIHPRLRGYIPVFLNPLIRFTAVMDFSQLQAWDIILGVSAVVGTRPGEDLTNAFSTLPT